MPSGQLRRNRQVKARTAHRQAGGTKLDEGSAAYQSHVVVVEPVAARATAEKNA